LESLLLTCGWGFEAGPIFDSPRRRGDTEKHAEKKRQETRENKRRENGGRGTWCCGAGRSAEKRYRVASKSRGYRPAGNRQGPRRREPRRIPTEGDPIDFAMSRTHYTEWTGTMVQRVCHRAGTEMNPSMLTMKPIGYVRSPYEDAREVPRGLGAKHTAEGVIEILAEFEDGLTDIEGFSHLFVIWAFDRSEGYELIGRPPTDNRPHGVFATRSPRRPNPIGLTVVELLRRDGALLYVRGIDMVEGTPILDIKPYLSSVPQERLRRGWLAEAEGRAQEEK
jgi:tRNA (adenine37-N6)-methyltransferase